MAATPDRKLDELTLVLIDDVFEVIASKILDVVIYCRCPVSFHKVSVAMWCITVFCYIYISIAKNSIGMLIASLLLR